MFRPTFSDDDFLELWRRHGATWSYVQYADAISDKLGLTGDDRLTASALRARVHRRRDAWEERGDKVAFRQFSHRAIFSAWPDLSAGIRNTYLYRFLELESAARQGGEKVLPPSMVQRWRTLRKTLLDNDEVIRYDPDTGKLFQGKRLPHEAVGTLVEDRETYVRRIHDMA